MVALRAYTYSGGHSTNVEVSLLAVSEFPLLLMEYKHQYKDWDFDTKYNSWYIGHPVYPDFTIEPILELK